MSFIWCLCCGMMDDGFDAFRDIGVSGPTSSSKDRMIIDLYRDRPV